MHPQLQKLRAIMCAKKTHLAVAADLTTSSAVLDLAAKIGPQICLLKTHIDLLRDFTPEFPAKLRTLANKHNFLIFEDRKFADIGNTAAQQFAGGIYQIAKWADFINAHTFVGASVIAGLKKANRNSGLILLAQMSTADNFFTTAYALKTVALAQKNSDFCVGFIGSSDKPETLRKIRAKAGPDFLILTPGIQLNATSDKLGQTYNTPQKAFQNGADILIVGRGIYTAADPEQAAKNYQTATKEFWQLNP